MAPMTEQSRASGVLGAARAMWDEIWSDHALMMAAGLSFYAVLGLLPALAAAAALWGQFGDLDSLKQSVESGGKLFPQGTSGILKQFVTSVPKGFGGGLGLVLNLLLVVATCYRAASGLLATLNIVYDLEETRLGVLFRFAVSREPNQWWSVAIGAVVATALWIAASYGVTAYARFAGSFGRLYGSLGAVVVALLWFYASGLAVLTGAEVDATLAERASGRPHSELKSQLRRRERAERH